MRAAGLFAAALLAAAPASARAEELDFNSGWLFNRGDLPSPSWASADFDDSAFAQVETPHDWSSDDLPAREDDTSTPVLAVRAGSWQFFPGIGNASFAGAEFDDSSWSSVKVPAAWSTYGYTQKNATAWYRRKFTVTAADLAAAHAGELRLALGTVSEADVTYVNGVKVGSMGTMGGKDSGSPYPGAGENSCDKPLTFRSYGSATGHHMDARTGETGMLASALKLGDDNVIAVQVYGGSGGEDGLPSGLYDTGAPDERSGIFDAGASPGQRQTGYAVGGVGVYRKHFKTPTVTAAAAAAPAGATSSRSVIYFEGCYQDCTVMLNGKLLGKHPYGYTSFSYDATELLAKDGGMNTIAVRVNNTGANSRWYSGSGLFRPVSLLTTPDVHVATWGGVYITTPGVKLLSSSPSSSGTYVEASTEVALVVQNDGDTVSKPVQASVKIYRSDTPGTVVATGHSSGADVGGIPAGGSANISVSIPATTGLAAWGPSTPVLYTAEVTLSFADAEADEAEDGGVGEEEEEEEQQAIHTVKEEFGYRSFSFDAKTGFTINGEQMKLYGGCVHHDNGPLGSKAIARAEERRVELLKGNGYNAIRTSHNPVSRAFVAACNKHGVMLMEEAFDCWADGKNVDDYNRHFEAWWQRDVTSMVLRDRNAPSIIMWSIGNEIPMRKQPAGIALSKAISDYIRSLDPSVDGTTRAVTSAYPGVGEDKATDDYLAPLDVAGYNYSPNRYSEDHKRLPERIIVATETFPADSIDYWIDSWEDNWVLGNFIWTAIDYIGESAIGANGHNTPDPLACGAYCAQPFPYHISFCGDLDVVGGQKPQAYLRRVLWNNSKLEMAVHAPVAAGEKEVIGAWGYPDERQSWSWGEANDRAAAVAQAAGGMDMSVNVYSNHECVKLFLNDKQVTPPPDSGGVRMHPKDSSCVVTDRASRFTATFTVPYSPGDLTAKSYVGGVEVGNVTFTTAKQATKLRLVVDRETIDASRSDLSYVVAEVVDEAGVVVTCEDEHKGSSCSPPVVSFAVSGAGELEAVGSGDPIDPASFKGPERMTYRGRATAIVRPGKAGAGKPSAGEIKVTAKADGLGEASVTITTQ